MKANAADGEAASRGEDRRAQYRADQLRRRAARFTEEFDETVAAGMTGWKWVALLRGLSEVIAFQEGRIAALEASASELRRGRGVTRDKGK